MSSTTPSTPDGPLAIALQQALVLQQQGRLAEALARYEEVLEASSSNFEALHGAGITCGLAGRLEDALPFLAAACVSRPDDFTAHFNRGKALHGLTRREEALAAYDRAIVMNAGFAPAYCNRGNVLKDLGRLGASLDSYGLALALKPHYVNALHNSAAVLVMLQRYEEAMSNAKRALTLQPARAESLRVVAAALVGMGRHEEALAAYAGILALNPSDARAYNSRGLLLLRFKSFADALAAFDHAAGLDPDLPYLAGHRLYAQMSICRWENWRARVDALAEALDRGVIVASPFLLLAAPISAARLQQCARLYARDAYPAHEPMSGGERHPHGRIRLGYFSADFHNHATAYLTAELFERHDRSRFEIHAYSFGPAYDGEMRQRLLRGFDHFYDVAQEDSRAIAALARRHEIDIAIDLKGYTEDSRPEIFAWRPAPVQVSWLGYPGTLGTPYLDYIIADRVVLPAEHSCHFDEKVIHMPHSYQVNDSRRPAGTAGGNRESVGLPHSGFVFCCFNNSFKITPDVFAVWMRLLARIDGSVLWLLETHEAARHNLLQEARRFGIEPARLVFAPRLPLAQHLSRHHYADLFLDTFYYNAHTTTSDALWTGLPVVTCLGDSFAGRVAASLLQALGLPELIAATHEDYEALALHLGTDRDALTAIKAKLGAQRLSRPLFDTAVFARHIESAYMAVWERHCRGLPPDHVAVDGTAI